MSWGFKGKKTKAPVKADGGRKGELGKLYGVLFVCFIIFQAISFGNSFVGVMLYISNAPVETDLVETILKHLPKDHYRFDKNDARRLTDVYGAPEQIVMKVHSAIGDRIYFDEKRLLEEVLGILNDLDPGQGAPWLQTEPFVELARKVREDGKLSRDDYEAFLSRLKASREAFYRTRAKLFQEVKNDETGTDWNGWKYWNGLGNWLKRVASFSRDANAKTVSGPQETDALKNVSKPEEKAPARAGDVGAWHGEKAVRDALWIYVGSSEFDPARLSENVIRLGHFQANEILAHAIVSMSEREISAGVGYLAGAGAPAAFAFVAAMACTLFVSASMLLLQRRGRDNVARKMFLVLVLVLGFAFSGLSSYCFNWSINNSKSFVDQSMKLRRQKIDAAIDKSKDNIVEYLKSKVKDIYAEKKNRYLADVEKSGFDFATLVSQMETEGAREAKVRLFEKLYQEHFVQKEDPDALQARNAAMSQFSDKVKAALGEANGEITNVIGYGPKSQSFLWDAGSALLSCLDRFGQAEYAVAAKAGADGASLEKYRGSRAELGKIAGKFSDKRRREQLNFREEANRMAEVVGEYCGAVRGLIARSGGTRGSSAEEGALAEIDSYFVRERDKAEKMCEKYKLLVGKAPAYEDMEHQYQAFQEAAHSAFPGASLEDPGKKAFKGIHEAARERLWALNPFCDAYFLPAQYVRSLDGKESAKLANQEVHLDRDDWVRSYETKLAAPLSVQKRQEIAANLAPRSLDLNMDLFPLAVAVAWDSMSLICAVIMGFMANPLVKGASAAESGKGFGSWCKNAAVNSWIGYRLRWFGAGEDNREKMEKERQKLKDRETGLRQMDKIAGLKAHMMERWVEEAENDPDGKSKLNTALSSIVFRDFEKIAAVPLFSEKMLEMLENGLKLTSKVSDALKLDEKLQKEIEQNLRSSFQHMDILDTIKEVAKAKRDMASAEERAAEAKILQKTMRKRILELQRMEAAKVEKELPKLAEDLKTQLVNLVVCGENLKKAMGDQKNDSELNEWIKSFCSMTRNLLRE